MSFPPEMDQRVTRNASRLAKGRGRSRNVGNLHVINTSLPAAVISPPECIRTVTLVPKQGQTITTRAFAVQKDAAMSFTKKKINAAKNFLQQHNKESPVKKTMNSKVNLTDDYSKPNSSGNDPSLNLSNNNLLPSTSSSNMASHSPNGSVTSNSSNNLKSVKYKPENISPQSHSCLAGNEVDMALRAKNGNTTQTITCKEKNEILSQKDESWVPVDMKKTNIAKDLSVNDKNKNFIKKKNFASKNMDRYLNRPVFNKYTQKEKKKATKMYVDSKGERGSIHRYSSSSRHFPSRQDEERYYEKRYGISRRSKNRRSQDYERERKRYYKESYPYHFPKKSQETRKSYNEEFEDVSDVPLDEDFEEVETASLEEAIKPSEIPVGFRKYKIRYLTSKSIGFFKPKIYQICQDRTVVSCLNMEEEESVDVVSEAEYETDHIVVEMNSKDDKLDADNSKLATSSKSSEKNVSETVDDPMEIENAARTPEITNNLFAIAPSKPELGSSTNILVSFDELNDLAKMDASNTVINVPSIKKKQEIISGSKLYYTWIPESDSPDFYQGQSLSQKDFDEWESHLIGLEYILEVRNMNKTQVIKYHCVLCMEQLTDENTDTQIVTYHVSSYKHAFAYMAKHFPSCGYKFSKKESSSNVLQKCCKEINHKLSYYFLCVTTDDYFQKHEKEVKEILNELPHWNDSNINIDAFVNDIESDVNKEISLLMKDKINKVAPGEEIATFITSRNESAQELRRKKSRNSIIDIPLLNDSLSVDNSVTSGRNLIVLTPQHRPIPKCSSDLGRPNLLQVITHKQIDSSIDNSNEIISQALELCDQNLKDMSEKSVSSPVDNDSLNFKSINKKAVSCRKYRAKLTADQRLMGPENKEFLGMCTVRKITKSSGEITVCLESKNIDENANMSAFDEDEIGLHAEVSDNLSNETGVQVLEDSTIESNFTDSLGVSNVISPQDAGNETSEIFKSKCKAKHRGHQRATHSRHCLKRILGKSSKSAKESIKKELSDLDIQFDNKSNDSDLERKFKNISPADSKTSSSSRKITSPLRTCYSPVFSSELSRLSVRRRSRSPPRRRSRSPPRKRRSPFKRGSRSPNRRHSRSPRRHSRSPLRRRSRSPMRRSRSPIRRRSRSPIRRRSRSPFRRWSRSPLRRWSRSPVRRRSQSPMRRRSRSPIRRRSRSPVGHRSRSPRTSIRRISRSPIHGHNSRKNSMSPSRRAYPSESYIPMSKHISHTKKKYESDKASYKSESRNLLYGDSISKSGLQKEFLTSSRSKYERHPQHESERDLDPISDDDEPAYFNTLEGPQHLEEIKKLPEPTRTMVMQLLQKFSATKVTPKDPTFSELMHFVNSHNSEMSNPHNSLNQEGLSNKPASSFSLQQFLLSNLTQTSGHQNSPPSHAITHASPGYSSPHTSGVPFSSQIPDLPPGSFSQSVFPNVQHHVSSHQSVLPPISGNHPPTFDDIQSVHAQFRPPQYDRFQSPNEPSFQTKPRSDGMFKNLKDTVSKLFGAIEGDSNEQTQFPSHDFLDERSQSQWARNPQNSFGSFDSKKVIHDDRDDSDFRDRSRGSGELIHPNKSSGSYYPDEQNLRRLHVPPPDAKIAFCDASNAHIQKNMFPVKNSPKAVDNVKKSLAQRLAAVLVKVGMLDVSGGLLQEMLMKIGAFSACPPQDISEEEIINILRRLGYLNRY